MRRARARVGRPRRLRMSARCQQTAEQLERIQGQLPEHIHVELGSGERETLQTADFIAFFRRSRERLLAAIAGEGAAHTWPWPVYHSCSPRSGRTRTNLASSSNSASSQHPKKLTSPERR